MLDEMADVQIMLDQLKIIYGWDYSRVVAKLVRLQGRIKDEQES